MRRTSLRLGLALLALLAGSCVVPPMVWQEGLPAHVPDGGPPELMGGADLLAWSYSEGVQPIPFFRAGLRAGQHVGRFAFEEGITGSIWSVGMVGLHAGVGLNNPAIILRSSVYPLMIGSSSSVITFENAWWQVQVLGGPRFQSGRLNWSAGVGTSMLGIGPTVMLEYGSANLVVRAQTSVTSRAPWSPEETEGSVFALGLTLAGQPKAKAKTKAP